MYVMTPRASAWLDADGSVDALEQLPARPSRLPSQTIEARKAFDGRLGRYIAIRRVFPASPGGRDLLLVGVANKSPTERGPMVGEGRERPERAGSRSLGPGRVLGLNKGSEAPKGPRVLVKLGPVQ